MIKRLLECTRYDSVAAMSRPPLSPRQQVLYDEIKLFIAEKRYSPSCSELAARMHVSTSATQKALTILQLKGYITRGDNHVKSIIIVGDDESIQPSNNR